MRRCLELIEYLQHSCLRNKWVHVLKFVQKKIMCTSHVRIILTIKIKKRWNRRIVEEMFVSKFVKEPQCECVRWWDLQFRGEKNSEEYKWTKFKTEWYCLLAPFFCELNGKRSFFCCNIMATNDFNATSYFGLHSSLFDWCTGCQCAT